MTATHPASPSMVSVSNTMALVSDVFRYTAGIFSHVVAEVSSGQNKSSHFLQSVLLLMRISFSLHDSNYNNCITINMIHPRIAEIFAPNGVSESDIVEKLQTTGGQ